MSKILVNYQKICSISLSLLLASFVVFYFTDGLSKIIFRTSDGFYRFGPILKGAFEFFVIGFSLLTLRKQKFVFLTGTLVLVGVFLIGQFFLYQNFKELNFLENFNTLFKYLFPLILYMLAIDVFDLPAAKQSRTYKIYKTILGFNSLLVFYGVFFGNIIIQTYNKSYRYGYDGLIFAQNEASYIFILAIFTVYYRRFYLKIKEWFFWLIILSSMFVATKAIYLCIILLILYHIFTRVSFKKIVIIFISGFVLSYMIFNSIINEVFLNSYNIFMHSYQSNGLLFALMSGRNTFIEEKLVPLILEIWTFPNFIFGGQDVSNFYMEMGFLDLFLFFGFFGTLIYSYLFYKLIRKINFSTRFKIFFIFIFFGIVATAGHFFTSGIAGLHFIFFLIINSEHSREWK